MALLYVHGGVSGVARSRPSLSQAVAAGKSATRAIDVVERAIVVMEDDPVLNAGYGSVLNREGRVELDAGLVDGATGRCGAVAATTVANPIRLARRVLEDTPHVLLVGSGADALGNDMRRIERTTDAQHRRWEEARASGGLAFEDYAAPEHVDTVGAVALDEDGNLVAGSSTGGVFGQLPGRVGDAPILGAGIYASAGAAVVGTGVGELFLETMASARAGRLIEEGEEPQRACELVIRQLGSTGRTSAGLLALDREGRLGAAYRGAVWSVEGPDGHVNPASIER
jgi:L-asparaginase / beta-aspartyl-peptidase